MCARRTKNQHRSEKRICVAFNLMRSCRRKISSTATVLFLFISFYTTNECFKLHELISMLVYQYKLRYGVSLQQRERKKRALKALASKQSSIFYLLHHFEVSDVMQCGWIENNFLKTQHFVYQHQPWEWAFKHSAHAITICEWIWEKNFLIRLQILYSIHHFRVGLFRVVCWKHMMIFFSFRYSLRFWLQNLCTECLNKYSNVMNTYCPVINLCANKCACKACAR